jgi:hypothetical protein
MGLDGQRHAPAALSPGKGPGNNRTGGRVGSQDRSGRVQEILPPPEFDLRTVQPVASRHTDNATPVRTTFGKTAQSFMVRGHIR